MLVEKGLSSLQKKVTGTAGRHLGDVTEILSLYLARLSHSFENFASH